MGSQYCKDFIFDNVKLNRIDAHQGIYNLTVKNSEIGYYGFTLTGKGILDIENTTVSSESFITLRGDYGSTWDGNVYIKNLTLDTEKDRNCDNYVIIPNFENKNTSKVNTNYWPKEVYINNYKFVNNNCSDPHISLLAVNNGIDAIDTKFNLIKNASADKPTDKLNNKSNNKSNAKQNTNINTNTNTNTNVNININTSNVNKDSDVDSTQSKLILPKTGKSTYIMALQILIVIATINSIVFWKKQR